MAEEVVLCITFVLYKKTDDVNECYLPNEYGSFILTDLGMSIIMEFHMIMGDF
jgi:hypothetical protein